MLSVFQLTYIRPWKKGDEVQLLEIANNFDIWKNLTDAFPYPYTAKDAEEWVKSNSEADPCQNFAIIVNGKIAGGAGFSFRTGNFIRCAEVGYWLGESYWGKGIATHVLKELTTFVFLQYPDIFRLEAIVAEYNPPSMRVLEKCGYEKEGVMKKKFLKNGVLWDLFLFSRLRQ